uniref:RNA ligase 2 n=1 Tax=Pithovirus LCPAC401 TaxID=2506595 RepID=A0A481ZBG5_9VIRU|nr:MAG: RNA ligase 2 [Pithovirus LCPAC401]
MNFEKYPCMKNTKFVKKIKKNAPIKERFVVQEKIHGSNFSFWSDVNETLPARKCAFLKKGENFYNYYENMRRLFEDLRCSDNVKVVIVCGELYGGVYPGMKTLGAVIVQHEVLYCSHNDYIVFDIKIDDNYLPPHEVNELCDKHDIPRLEILEEGSLDDCLKYPNDFISRISSIHGLPQKDGNICEGTVIKPVVPRTLRSGGRVILKNKNKKFSEVKEKTVQISEGKSDEISDVAAIMSSYVRENRLKNVLSKMGLIGHDEDPNEYFKSLKHKMMRDVGCSIQTK